MSDFPTVRPTPPDDDEPGLRVTLHGYQLSDEVRAVAERIIEAHPRLQYLAAHNLVYLLDHEGPPEHLTTDAVAKARRITGWQQALTPHRGALVVDAKTWAVLGERQRSALMLHHLLHFGENERTGALELVGHDVEEFHLVAATYGQWQPSLRDFAEQLAMGLDDGR